MGVRISMATTLIHLKTPSLDFGKYNEVILMEVLRDNKEVSVYFLSPFLSLFNLFSKDIIG